ncbi:metal-dependent hydrolase [Paenibacillus sp. GCM10027626]|uniref:metal-dependent hydrolase n=1 Tax=Paenibacillus sp. GCM10027626 TaxID=3273411 RepID=UPI003637DB00
MKGTTHLAIGVGIGLAAAAYYPFTPNNAALYITVAAFSSLSPDLDGNSMLSSKLGKVSKLVRELLLWGGVALAIGVAYVYYDQRILHQQLALTAGAAFLLGFIAKEGSIRNILVSLIGGAVLYWGMMNNITWMIGFGLFVAIAPWMHHRGLTHTLWALIAWGAIGAALESELQLEGISNVAIAGYLSHLITDTMTPAGVKWLYPLSKKSIKIMH